jgi:hypothetical protein
MKFILEACRDGGDAHHLADHLRAWFKPAEQIKITPAALLALDDTDAKMLAEPTLAELHDGPPIPPLEGLMNKAWR